MHYFLHFLPFYLNWRFRVSYPNRVPLLLPVRRGFGGFFSLLL